MFDDTETEFERTLHFPSDRPIGMIYLTDDESACLSGCEYAEACGDVTVNLVPGENIGLWAEEPDLSALKALKPDDLQWLHLEAANDHNLSVIKRLTGLTELIVTTFDFPDSVSDAGVAHISTLTKLKRLTLHDLGISAEALNTVALLPKLKYLTLSKLPISDQGLTPLAKLHLDELALYELPLTDHSVSILAEFNFLKQLNLWRSGLSTNAIQQLTTKLPQTKVTGLGPKPEHF